MKKIFSLALFSIILLSGCIGQKPAPLQTETPTQSVSPTEPPKPNAIVGYAKDKLSQEIITLISPADKDGILDDVEKSIIDYLRILPEEQYRKIAAQEVMRDSVLTKEDVTFLANYSNSISKSIREMEDLENDNFTLEDGQQTDLEKSFLANPNDQKLAQDLKKYYLGEIEKIYPELASELNKLPELSPLNVNEKSLEALEDIYGLLLTAKPYKNYDDRFKSNIPKENETWEAFELMIKGGTPDPKDYTYPVPNYNTELQALLWIAEQNEFKKNDTLAQSIAMDNGLYITMGDEQVRVAVYKDTNDLLKFFRDTNMWQLENGFYLLEDYPLEAKVALGWTGGLNMHWVGQDSQPTMPMRLSYYGDKKLPLIVYQKDIVSVATMKKMRSIAEKEKWWSKDVNISVKMLEDYFFTYPVLPRWEYRTFPNLILDENGLDAWLDIDWQFNRYLKGLKPQGDCGTEASFIDAWAKSIGIATLLHWMYETGEPVDLSNMYRHSYTIYFVAEENEWKAYERQVQLYVPHDTNIEVNYFIFKPPVNQKGYIKNKIFFSPSFSLDENSAYIIKNVKLQDTQRTMLKGISTIQMKQWLLYSNG